MCWVDSTVNDPTHAQRFTKMRHGDPYKCTGAFQSARVAIQPTVSASTLLFPAISSMSLSLSWVSCSCPSASFS